MESQMIWLDWKGQRSYHCFSSSQHRFPSSSVYFSFSFFLFDRLVYFHPLTRFGYVSELLSRLEGDRKWVEQDRTKVNQTLDRSATTFPLNRSCYIDFSHDNQMVSIFAALGLQKNQTMSESGPARPNPSWNASDWMPFGSRLTIEKLACEEDAQEYVRFLMNDQSIRIPNPDLPFHHHLIPTGPESHPQYLYRLDKLVEFYGRALNHSRDLYHQCSL